MTEHNAQVGEIRKIAGYVQISKDMAIREGLIPNDGSYTPPPPPTRRQKLRMWRQTHLTIYALRQALSYHLDPDPYKDDRD